MFLQSIFQDFKQGKELRIKLNSTNKVDNTLSSTDDTDSKL